MNAKRLLAILAASAMIAGAWFVRTKVIDNKTTVATGGGTTQPTDAPTTSRRVVCVAELEDACRASGSIYTVEPVSTTLAMLASEPNPDIVWITTSPLPEMADAARLRANQPPLPVDQRKALGSTTVVVAAPTERVTVLKAACPDLSWKCIGEKTNRPWKEIGGQAGWQDVTFRHRDPLVSAGGLSVFGAALAGRTGRTDIGTGDLAVSDVRSWTNQLENANKQPTSDPLTSIVVGTRFDLVGALATEDAMDLLDEGWRDRLGPWPVLGKNVGFKQTLQLVVGAVRLIAGRFVDQCDQANPRQAGRNDAALVGDAALLLLKYAFVVGLDDGFCDFDQRVRCETIGRRVANPELYGVLDSLAQVVGNERFYERSGHKKLKSTHTPFHRSAASDVEGVCHPAHGNDAPVVIQNVAWHLNIGDPDRLVVSAEQCLRRQIAPSLLRGLTGDFCAVLGG